MPRPREIVGEFNTKLLEEKIKNLRSPITVGIIYGIHCEIVNRFYIGITRHQITRSPDIGSIKRLVSHLWQLRVGKHPCKELQENWDKYPLFFHFDVIQVMPYNHACLRAHEAWWHEQLPNCYSSTDTRYAGEVLPLTNRSEEKL